MWRRNRPVQRVTVTPVVELNKLMTSPNPGEVIADLSEPVAKALLLHMVMEARYGTESA